MKKIIASFIVIFFILSITIIYAHPPRIVNVNYDSKTKTIEVVMPHPVANRTKHFIKRIEVFVNGEAVAQDIFHHQVSDAMQKSSFIIKDAKPGDVISVEGFCNKGGEKVGQVIVPLELKSAVKE